MKSKSRIKHTIFGIKKKNVSVHNLQLLCFLLLSSSKQKDWLPSGFLSSKSINSFSKSTQNNSDCGRMSLSPIQIAVALLLVKNVHNILK